MRKRHLLAVVGLTGAACSLLDPLDDILVGDAVDASTDVATPTSESGTPSIDSTAPDVDAFDAGVDGPVVFAMSENIAGLVATSDYVYWLGFDGDSGASLPAHVHRKPRQGGAIEKSTAAFSTYATGLAVSDTEVFVADRNLEAGTCVVSKISIGPGLTGAAKTILTESCSIAVYLDLAFDGELLVGGTTYASTYRLVRVGVDGGARRELPGTVFDEGRFVAAGGGRIYWVSNPNGQIVWSALPDGGAAVKIVESDRYTFGLAATPTGVLVLDHDFAAGFGTIRHLSPDGGDAGIVAELRAPKGFIAIDLAAAPDGRLYYGSPTDAGRAIWTLMP